MKKMLIIPKIYFIRFCVITMTILTFTAASVLSGMTSWAADSKTGTSDTVSVVYKVRSTAYGWQKEASDGEAAGIMNRNPQIEGLTACIKGFNKGIRYRVYVDQKGWQSWVYDNQTAGTAKTGLGIKAVEFQLYGKAAASYDLEYRVCCSRYGWMPWVRSGVSGVSSPEMDMQAIELRLIAKGSDSSSDKTAKQTISKKTQK